MTRPAIFKRTRVHALVLGFVLAGLSAPLAHADQVKLRHILTDQEGNFTVLFSLLDNNRDPVPNPNEIPSQSIRMWAGEERADLTEMDLDGVSIVPLREYQASFQVYILLPNTDQFNGTAQDADRPDHAQLRTAVSQALQSLPADRTDIRINLAVYNQEIQWLPQYDMTRLAELRVELNRQLWVAPTGTFLEDPFSAITNAYRTRLRRQSREAGMQDFMHFFIVVSSSLTNVDTASAEFGQEAQRVRGLLTGRDMSDVVTMVIVYYPGADAQTLTDPAREPIRFATGVTPEDGTYRIVGDIQAIQSALQQTIDEINSSMVLRFNNTQLEPDRPLFFKLALTRSGSGAEIESNLIEGHVQEVPVNIWKLIILIGSILVGVVLLLILVIYFLRRPKREPEEEAVHVVEAPAQLCVQCGRALREDLQYCHHCAAEPNHGILKVLEGADGGWTFFLREARTEVGRGVGNSIRLNDPGVSGTHMQISVLEGGRYLIEDLKSSSGTFIEGQKVEKQYLKNGDVIVIGSGTKLKFTIS